MSRLVERYVRDLAVRAGRLEVPQEIADRTGSFVQR